VAREATARLYDVDDDSVVYKKPKKRGKYDQGTITFRAKKGSLIDLDKLHESVWATRLSGGTRSGLVTLDVTTVGEVVVSEGETVLNVKGSDRYFVLIENPQIKTESGERTSFGRLRESIDRGDKVVSVTGRVEGWAGRWPNFLKELPRKPRKIMVASFQTAEE